MRTAMQERKRDVKISRFTFENYTYIVKWWSHGTLKLIWSWLVLSDSFLILLIWINSCSFSSIEQIFWDIIDDSKFIRKLESINRRDSNFWFQNLFTLHLIKMLTFFGRKIKTTKATHLAEGINLINNNNNKRYRA